MSDELKKILERLDLIDARLDSLQISTANLKKEQIGQDLQVLFSEVVFRKRMSVSQIMNRFKISRNWALNRMRKLAREFSQIEFYVGDKIKKRESVLFYSEDKENEIVFQRIVNLMKNNEVVTFAEINKVLLDLIGKDIDRVVIFANRLVKKYPEEYAVEGDNKLIKKNVNS